MAPSKKKTTGTLLLAGDIGASNTRLGLYPLNGDHRTPLRVGTYKGNEYSGLGEILHDFLGEDSDAVVAACFGAAGPVVAGRVKLTNLAWIVDSVELLAEFSWQNVWLLNDLQAIANAVPVLKHNELHTLNVGVPESHGNIVAIGPGTGLGIAYLTWAAGRYHPHASEGGHSDFAPANAVQDELLSFLRKTYRQVAIEHVASGLGLPNVYEFLKTSGRAREPQWLAAELAGAEDVNPIIVKHALAQSPRSEICQMTVQIFVDVLAAQAGSLALLFGSTGGVYLGGGIPPLILPAFERYNFVKTFISKTAYEYYLERFPVRVITASEPGLLGAAEFGLQQVLRSKGS